MSKPVIDCTTTPTLAQRDAYRARRAAWNAAHDLIDSGAVVKVELDSRASFHDLTTPSGVPIRVG
jgi:hypothetical protein